MKAALRPRLEGMWYFRQVGLVMIGVKKRRRACGKHGKIPAGPRFIRALIDRDFYVAQFQGLRWMLDLMIIGLVRRWWFIGDIPQYRNSPIRGMIDDEAIIFGLSVWKRNRTYLFPSHDTPSPVEKLCAGRLTIDPRI